MAEGPDLLSSSSSLYDFIGVRTNATEEEIYKAYKHKAREYHPDKNPEINEELMKTLNRAKEVLTDKIKRRNYDEQKDDEQTMDMSQLTSILQGYKLSVLFSQDYEQWLKMSIHLQKTPNRHLSAELQKYFTKGDFLFYSTTNYAEKRKMAETSEDDNFYEQVITEFCSAYSTSFKPSDHKLNTVLETMRITAGTNVLVRMQTPILDINCLNDSNIQLLLQNFLPLSEFENITVKSHDSKLKLLNSFIPMVTVEDPPAIFVTSSCKKCNKYVSSSLGCTNCGQTFCDKCVSHAIKLPRKGILQPMKVCDSCFDLNTKEDLKQWLALSKCLLDEKNEEVAAIGCFKLALLHCSSRPYIEIIQKMANTILSTSSTHIAVPFIALSLRMAGSSREKLLAHSQLTSFCLATMKQKNVDIDDRKAFLEIGKEANKIALSDTSLEMPALSEQLKEIKSQTSLLGSDIELHYTTWVKETKELFNEAWLKRDWLEMVDILSAHESDPLDDLTGKNAVVEATKYFLKEKESFLDRMQSEDKYGLMFFRGVTKLSSGEFESGLADIETAAWSGTHSEWLVESAVEIFLDQFNKPDSKNISLYFTDACKDLGNFVKKFVQGNRSQTQKPKLLPNDSEINPRETKTKWPSLYVSGRNTRAIKMYENAIVKMGISDEHQAGLTYIDLVQACTHPVESSLCFVRASMWFYQELVKKNAACTITHSEANALKNLILKCINSSLIIARSTLHPTTQFHICRTGLAIVINTISITEQYIDQENSQLIISLMNSILYNYRFCPFWHTPATNVSEAILFNLISAEIHSNFLEGLQHHEILPVQEFELDYQIYENSFRHIGKHSDTNPDDLRNRAMQVMLDNKGLSWNDIANTLTSPLTPRDENGWLKPQLGLGDDLPFSSLRGFEFEIGTTDSNIGIFYESSGSGLFSMSDVNEVLKHQDNIFFVSLDPPSIHQQFHPFQKIRCDGTTDENTYNDYCTYQTCGRPGGLQGTRSLYTMLHADYLLKSFSIGSEVSAKPPFKQRPCESGLTAHLPPHLKKVLKSVTERGYSQYSMHRFWIQADEIRTDVKETNSKITFTLDEPKMTIRTHPLIPKDGKLEDTDESEDPDSPAAQFAADLTKHYNELEKYFPVFKRLKEISKLIYFSNVIKTVQKSLEENANQEERNINTAVRMAQDQYWLRTEEVQQILDSIKASILSGIEEISKPFSHYSTTTADLFEDTAKTMKDQLHLSESQQNIEYHLKGWIQDSNMLSKTTLVELIMGEMSLPTRENFLRVHKLTHKSKSESFNKTINMLMQSAEKNNRVKTKKECTWVPAAMNIQQDKSTVSICYGGVLLNCNGKMGRVSRTLSGTRYSKLTADIVNQRKDKWEGTNSNYKVPTRQSGNGSKNDWDNSSKNKRSRFNVLLTLSAGSRNYDDANKPVTLPQCLKTMQAVTTQPKTSTCLEFSNDDIVVKCTGEIITTEPQEQNDTISNCVYLITDRITGERYVGLTTRQLYKRLNEHCSDKKSAKSAKSAVNEHFTKNGKLCEEDMIVTVLYHNPTFTRKQLHAKETDYINNIIFPEINKHKKSPKTRQKNINERKKKVQNEKVQRDCQ